MLTHTTGDVTQVVNRFKQMGAPAVLVSPTVTTGWDFPQGGGKPQYIIIGKLAYPTAKDPILQARQEDDKEWSSFMAMEVLIQESGRMTRSSTDLAEIFCVDDNITWFLKAYSKFAPKWFMQRYKGSLSCVPEPLV
jgi:Rad3-related DNA helicase